MKIEREKIDGKICNICSPALGPHRFSEVGNLEKSKFDFPTSSHLYNQKQICLSVGPSARRPSG